jgi:DNA-binding transcriptional MocR family regulator
MGLLRYERLADEFGQRIERGVLRAGERMPSLRQVSQDARVSMATAVEAYLQLERRGLIEARPRSGYYVRTPHRPVRREPARLVLTPRPIRNPGLLCTMQALAGRPLVQMHAATPSPALLPATQLRASMLRAARHDMDAVLRYAPAEGLADLRHRIAERYSRHGTDVDPQEVVVTAGAMEAVSLALRAVTRPGDVVLLEKPTYHGLLQAVAALDLRALEVPTRTDGIDVACLRKQLANHKVRVAILVPNVNNPLGVVASDEDKRAIVEACAEHGTLIIEDDVYADLVYANERPAPLRRFARPGATITCGAFSKSLAPGLRVGWVLAGPMTEAIVREKSFSTVATATLSQAAIADYLGRHDFERHLRRLRQQLSDNMQRMRDAIARHWPEGTETSDPAGGLSLWVRLPDGVDGGAFHEAALDRGIGVMPGNLFSMRGEHVHHVRLSWGDAWSDEAERAVRTLGQLV